MSRLSTFDRLDALPSWAKKGPRPKGKRNVVAADLPIDLAERLAGATQTVGLSASDLCRVGLLRVIEEIEKTGAVRVHSLAPGPRVT